VKPAGVKNEKKAFVYTQTSWCALALKIFAAVAPWKQLMKEQQSVIWAVAGARPASQALSQIENAQDSLHNSADMVD
jgi:hypothetical protein